jgi:peptidyl-prolyl cis-trans isomerase B (cyclophilin B)
VAGKDRKKQLARQRYERQQARREAQQRRARRTKIIGSVVAIVLVAGAGAGLAAVIGRDDKAATNTQANAGAQATPTAQPSVTVKPGECAYQPKSEQGKNVGTPPKKPADKGTVRATLKTNLGDIALDLDGAKAPCTVSSMAFLANKGYFDNTKCHRLVTEGIKVLQCGDPTGTGSGGPGYEFANENTQGATYKRGVLAMANAGPNTNGSQFFIVYGDSQLPPDYTVFGKVAEGMNVVDEVAKAGAADPDPATGNTAPKKKIEIKDVAISKK